MKKGYAILECGFKFDIELGWEYNTYWPVSNSIILKGVLNSRDITSPDSFEHPCASFYTAVYIEAPDNEEKHRIRLKELVLPDGIIELFIGRGVSLVEPLILPDSMQKFTIPSCICVGNLDMFADNKAFNGNFDVLHKR